MTNSRAKTRSLVVSKSPTRRTARRHLAAYFERNGYIRWQNAARLAKLGPQRYKKGNEARLVAESEAELAYMQVLLDVLGFAYGRPFAKARQYCIPIYGREQISRFAALVGERAE